MCSKRSKIAKPVRYLAWLYIAAEHLSAGEGLPTPVTWHTIRNLVYNLLALQTCSTHARGLDAVAGPAQLVDLTSMWATLCQKWPDPCTSVPEVR